MAERRTGKISDETKEELGPEAAKAAEKAPAGDPNLSGAAPGAKVEGKPELAADTTQTFDKPRATLKAEKAAAKRADEVREIQLDVHRLNVTNVPNEGIQTAYAAVPEKGDPDSISFARVGNEVVVTTTGSNMTFGREEWLGFQRKVSAIGAAG